MSNKCGACGKTVYAMEEAKAVGKSFHKTCIKSDVISYEKQFVDEETKQQIYEMESTYAKKVHGSAKALPGFGNSSGGPPVPAARGPPPGPPRPAAAYAAEPPPPPRRAMPMGLQSAIVNSGGVVPRNGGVAPPVGRAPPPRPGVPPGRRQ